MRKLGEKLFHALSALWLWYVTLNEVSNQWIKICERFVYRIYSNWKKTEIKCKIPSTLLRKIWLTLVRFLQNFELLYEFMYKSPIPNLPMLLSKSVQ
jgi:hypothetical protein